MSGNIFPVDFQEKNDIAQNDYILFSDSQDGNKLKKAQYSNLKGEKGDTGARINSAAFSGDDIEFGETDGNTVTLANAKTTLTGPQGEAATITVGTTTTGEPGTSATVTNSGTSTAAVFDFTIPAGETGNGIASVTSSKVGKTTTVTITETNGDSESFQIQDGNDGTGTGDVVGPASSTDGHLAVFDGVTGKLIKDGGAVPSPTTVVDSLESTSTTSALSANQGKVLDGKISDLFGLGKFLSLWDATTGLPISFPLETPYTYTTGDYFLVETVSSANPPVNYRPTGSSYNGTASSTTESDELEAGDVYIYDGSVWLLQSNHGKSVAFSNIAGDAMDNANLSGYLNTKAFYLSSTSDLTTAQKAFEWQNGGKTAIVIYNDKPYAFSYYNTASMAFVCLLYREQLEAGNSKTSLVRDVITFTMTGGTTVSSISANAWNNIIASVLKTDTDYATPYTPQYNGSPATKKYVDDNAGLKISSQSNNILTSGATIRAGSQSDYENLGSYDNNTVYLTI